MTHFYRQILIMRYIDWRTWRFGAPPTLSEMAIAFHTSRESMRRSLIRMRRDYPVMLSPEPRLVTTFPTLEDCAPNETYVNLVHSQGERVVA